jgi:hypothetical protein
MSMAMAGMSAKPAASRESPGDLRETRVKIAFIERIFLLGRVPGYTRPPCARRREYDGSVSHRPIASAPVERFVRSREPYRRFAVSMISPETANTNH